MVHDEVMRRNAAADQCSGASEPPAVALRGELWQRHVELQEMDPASAEYDAAVSKLVALTADLLRAEAEAREVRKGVRRGFGQVLYYLGAVLLIVAITVAALLAPAAVGGWVYRWTYAVVLVAAVLTATLMFRHTVAPPRVTAGPSAPTFAPET